MAVAQLQFPARSLVPLEANTPVQEVVDFGTVIVPVASFDDTTEEYLNGKFEVPQDIGTGDVTFRATVSPATGAASKNVAMTFGHRISADGQAIDGAYTDEDSGDKAITASTGNETIFEWTETVTNLNWNAEDTIYFRISRPQASANNLSGDMYLILFTIDIPLA